MIQIFFVLKTIIYIIEKKYEPLNQIFSYYHKDSLNKTQWVNVQANIKYSR